MRREEKGDIIMEKSKAHVKINKKDKFWTLELDDFAMTALMSLICLKYEEGWHDDNPDIEESGKILYEKMHGERIITDNGDIYYL